MVCQSAAIARCEANRIRYADSDCASHLPEKLLDTRRQAQGAGTSNGLALELAKAGVHGRDGVCHGLDVENIPRLHWRFLRPCRSE